MPLFVLIIAFLALGVGDVTAVHPASRRGDDVSFQSLMTLVQQQAATLQKQEASLQALQNQVSVQQGTISLLQQAVSNNTASLKVVRTQVFFTARMTSYHVTLGQDSPIKFDAVVTTIGGGYNPATGVFTAPVPGVYVFYAQLDKYATTSPIHWAIDKSGTVLCMNAGDDNIWDKSSCLATVRLQAGDQVFVKRVADHATGNTVAGGWWCSFTGYLTSADD